MSLYVQSNVEAMNAHDNLLRTSGSLSKAMERLSSGYRINRAADDAAGLAISEKLQAQIGGLDQASRNAQDAISLVQTAEGSMSEVHSMLQRIRELAVQYQNGTLSTSDKSAITSEVTQLTDEIERIGNTAQFNGIKLLNDSNAAVTFQIGANDGDVISVGLVSLGSATALASLDLSSSTVLADIDSAIEAVSAQRAQFGAVQNRLEHTVNNIATYQENLTASNAQIQDVDMASEMVSFTRLQVLQQAGTAMLAQANQSPQTILQLLR
ncbi:MAG TPA: flagellin [Solirubrobacteraceae bacterium]|jgi:flagellin|nr:flagellin [Solirubrobacteraceae bacterium]